MCFLSFQVQAVIHTVVILLGFTVSPMQPVQNSNHPHPLLRHLSIGSPLLLTCAHMPALPVGQGVFPALSLGVDGHRLLDDQPISISFQIDQSILYYQE